MIVTMKQDENTAERRLFLGETVDLPDELALHLISIGAAAEPVEDVQEDVEEDVEEDDVEEGKPVKKVVKKTVKKTVKQSVNRRR